ncbi:hypothetical protein X749_03020 [Mesorhizobium sp. LNJC391B00]|nr:hypothetical protein X749_03020 [Mesorhizobium sp. LNJC391B00]
MAEKALTTVVQEAYVQGISTRSVDDLVKAMRMRVQIAVEHPQCLILDVVAPVEGALVTDEGHDMRRDRTCRLGKTGAHCRSSPSPRAISRKPSTWTLA